MGFIIDISWPSYRFDTLDTAGFAQVKSKAGRRRSSGRADRPHPNALNQSSIYDSHVCGDSWQCCKCPRRGAVQCSSRGGHKQSVCTFPSHLSLCSPSLSVVIGSSPGCYGAYPALLSRLSRRGGRERSDGLETAGAAKSDLASAIALA